MPLYRPSELIARMRELYAQPKKGLSQNFLIDGNILDKIVASAAVAPDDLVVEIGPGPGALTEKLLDRGARVLAVEADATFANALPQLDDGRGLLQVVHSDILRYDLRAFLQSQGRRAKVVANLPYHLTAPIIMLLVQQHSLLESMHLLVQKEVAERLAAVPPSRQVSALALMVRLYGDPKLLFSVGPRCFLPPPKVTSALVGMALRAPPPQVDLASYSLLVHRLFEQRRKTIPVALQKLCPKEASVAALAQLGLGPLTRPEELTFPQLLQLEALLRARLGEAKD